MRKSVLTEKSFNFAIRIVNFYRYLHQEKMEYVLSNQLLRSGTAIGALISEGCYAESKLDFIHKYGIAQKECNETIYWLKLLFRTNYMNQKEFDSLENDAIELIKIISSSILTAKKSIKKPKHPTPDIV
ncbi:MAG: four helix bundle protein [Bacteroidota bacterium]|nr:four helix bundle protein [Bacteroidota bacterium]